MKHFTRTVVYKAVMTLILSLFNNQVVNDVPNKLEEVVENKFINNNIAIITGNSPWK